MGTGAGKPICTLAHGDGVSSRARIATAELNNAKRYTPYGAEWTRSRVTGRKPNDAGTTSTATITGYIVEKKLQPVPLLQPLGGAGVSATVRQWQWVSGAGESVSVGDVLTNAEDTTVVYRISTTPETGSGNLVADATRVR